MSRTGDLVFNGGELLEDQAGAGAALTFTFASEMDLIWVSASGGVGRADPFGGTPTSTKGVYIASGAAVPCPVQATVVKVFANAGTTISVWGFRFG